MPPRFLLICLLQYSTYVFYIQCMFLFCEPCINIITMTSGTITLKVKIQTRLIRFYLSTARPSPRDYNWQPPHQFEGRLTVFVSASAFKHSC